MKLPKRLQDEIKTKYGIANSTLKRKKPLQAKQKFGNVKTMLYGVGFDSKLEADYARYLKLLEMAGEIKDLQLKPPGIEILPSLRYKPDFQFTEVKTGLRVVVDTKGGATKGGRFPTICKLWRLFMQGQVLRVVERRGQLNDFVITKEIKPLPLTNVFLEIKKMRSKQK